MRRGDRTGSHESRSDRILSRPLVRQRRLGYHNSSETPLNDQMPELVAAAPAMTVDTDVPCISCGYDLRGLMTDWNCPECGTPIRNSLRGDLLEFCDPKWVGRLAMGARLVYIACWVCVPLVVCIALGEPWMLALLIHLAATCMFVVGSWLLTSIDRRGPMRKARLWSRWLTRAMAVVAIVQDAILLTSALWLGEAATYLLLLRTATAIAWIPVFGKYIQHLSLRLDHKSHQRIRKLATICWKIGCVVTATFVVVVMGIPLAHSGNESTSLFLHALLTPLVMVFFVLGFILFTRMLNMMGISHKAFCKTVDDAKRNWATGQSASRT